MSFITFLFSSVSFQFSLCLSIRKKISSQLQSKMNAFDSFENVFSFILSNFWTKWKSCRTNWLNFASSLTFRHHSFSNLSSQLRTRLSSRLWILRWLLWCSFFYSRISNLVRRNFSIFRSTMKMKLDWISENKVSFSECISIMIVISSTNSKLLMRKIDWSSRKRLTISWILIELTIFAFWSSSSIDASLFVVHATTRTNRRMLENIFEKHLNRKVWVLRNTIICSFRRRIDSRWRTHSWLMS
jgi:hypothetical protein